MDRPSVVPPHLPTEAHHTYWRLRREKWREGIDGCYQHFGPHVFDRGLHGNTIEPGFIDSWERGALFIHDRLGQKTTVDMYLELHRVVCRHFRGSANGTLMRAERSGVFRDKACQVQAEFIGVYTMTPKGAQEFYAQNLGTIEGKLMKYRQMEEGEVRNLLTRYLDDFHQEIEAAKNSDQKLRAIARLQQRMEWLHPVQDGTGRTDTLLMNKHLTEQGFHPAILDHPHLSSSLCLDEWTEKLREGLRKWEQKASQIQEYV